MAPTDTMLFRIFSAFLSSLQPSQLFEKACITVRSLISLQTVSPPTPRPPHPRKSPFTLLKRRAQDITGSSIAKQGRKAALAIECTSSHLLKLLIDCLSVFLWACAQSPTHCTTLYTENCLRKTPKTGSASEDRYALRQRSLSIVFSGRKAAGVGVDRHHVCYPPSLYAERESDAGLVPREEAVARDVALCGARHR